MFVDEVTYLEMIDSRGAAGKSLSMLVWFPPLLDSSALRGLATTRAIQELIHGWHDEVYPATVASIT